MMTGFSAYAMPVPVPEGPLSPDGFATIHLSRTMTAQGEIVRHHFDGRVTIDAGGREVTGYPVGHGEMMAEETQGSWFQRLLGR